MQEKRAIRPSQDTGIFLQFWEGAFPIGKISEVNPEFGKFSEYSKLIILPS